MIQTRLIICVFFATILTCTWLVKLSQAAERPKYGGTFVFATGTDPETLNPGLTTGVEALAVACKIFNGLIWLNRDWEPQPELAKSWEISQDGLMYRFTLREDVTWHDGKPFTAADVQFTFEEVLAKYHPRARLAFANVQAVEVPDPFTVVVKFQKPYAPFLQQMTCQDAPILPRHLYEGTDILKNPHNSDAPVGTGPFKWGEWVRGDHITLVRNAQYFRKDRPYLDRMIAKIIPDSVARILAIRSGDVDYIQSFFLIKQEVARLQQDPQLQVQFDTDLPGNFLLFFNVTRTPLDQKEVRQALTMGLNREQILQQAVFGLGSVGRSAIHRRLEWASNPEVDYTKMYPYDPVRAAAALDKAGLPKQGEHRFQIRLVYNIAQAGFEAMAQIIRDNWRAIGVDVILEPLEFQLVVDKVFKKRDYDVTIQPYTTAGDPAVGIARAYVTTPPGRPFTNPTGYSNPKVDDLFERAAMTPFRSERQKLYYEVQHIIAEDLPVLNLIDRTEADVARKQFRGLWQSAQPYDLWDRVWWVQGQESR